MGVNGFYLRVTMSSTSNDFYSSSNIIVAGVLADPDRKTITLCRPEDEKWCQLQLPLLDFRIKDILFSSGTLYVLVWDPEIEDFVSPSLILDDFAFDDTEHVKLKMVFSKDENLNSIVDAYSGGYNIISKAAYSSRLLESTNNQEVLICQIIFDYVVETEDDDEDIVVDFNAGHAHFRTRSFKTYKIDPENNKIHMIQSLGDQSVFYGADHVFSLSISKTTEQGNNRIYFAMNRDRKVGVYTNDDFGIFYFNGERIEWLFQGMEMSAKYRPCWFAPSL